MWEDKEQIIGVYNTTESYMAVIRDSYSMMERCIDLITSVLFGYDLGLTEIIFATSNVNVAELRSIQNIWYHLILSAGGKWSKDIVKRFKNNEIKPIGEFHAECYKVINNIIVSALMLKGTDKFGIEIERLLCFIKFYMTKVVQAENNDYMFVFINVSNGIDMAIRKLYRNKWFAEEKTEHPGSFTKTN